MRIAQRGCVAVWGVVLAMGMGVLGAPSAQAAIIHDDFTGPELDWVLSFSNTDDASWTRTFDENGLTTTGLIQTDNSTFNALVQLSKFVTVEGDFSGKFVHSWSQASGNERATVYVRLYDHTGPTPISHGNFGMVDRSSSDWANLVVQPEDTIVIANAGQTGTATWEFERIGDEIFFSLNGDPVYTLELQENAVIDEFRIVFGAHRLNHSTDNWTWEGEYTVQHFSIVPEPASVALLAMGGAVLLRRRGRTA